MESLDRCGFGAYLENMLLLPIPYSSLSVSILLASTCLLNHLGCLTSFFRGVHLGAGALLDRKLLRCVESFHAVAVSAHVSVGAMVGARCVGLVATTGGRSRDGIKGHPWGSIDAVRRNSGRGGGGGRMVVWLVLAAVWRAGLGVLLVVMRGLGGIRVVQLDRGKGRHIGPSHVLSRDCSHVGQRIKADDDEIEDGDGCEIESVATEAATSIGERSSLALSCVGKDGGSDGEKSKAGEGWKEGCSMEMVYCLQVSWSHEDPTILSGGKAKPRQEHVSSLAQICGLWIRDNGTAEGSTLIEWTTIEV